MKNNLELKKATKKPPLVNSINSKFKTLYLMLVPTF